MSIYDGTVPNETQDMLEVLASVREDFDAIRTGGNFEFERVAIRSTASMVPKVAGVTLAHYVQLAAARVFGFANTSGHQHLYLSSNAGFNTSNTWVRDDTAKVAWAISIQPDSDLVGWWRAAAGANPISWTALMQLQSDGRLELFRTSGAALKVQNTATILAPQTGNAFAATLTLCNASNATLLDVADQGLQLRRTRASDGAAQNVLAVDSAERVTFYKDTIRSGQETGRLGLMMPAGGGVGYYAGVYQPFRHKRATAPSSITLTMENQQNAMNAAAVSITTDGFNFQYQFSAASGNTWWNGTYSTNG